MIHLGGTDWDLPSTPSAGNAAENKVQTHLSKWDKEFSYASDMLTVSYPYHLFHWSPKEAPFKMQAAAWERTIFVATIVGK